MSDATTGDETPEAVLLVQIGGGHGEPERVLHISRPTRGRVRVREWTSAAWNAGGPVREMPAAEALAMVARAAAAGRRVSEEMYRVRAWLADEAP